MSGVQKTYAIGQPRADFEKSDFEQIIYQKGRRVWYERAIQCPCKSVAANQQSNCQNCGSSGWLFINGRETRMIISGLGIVNDFKPWSEESRGMINISCYDSEELTFMDRLTLLDAKSIYQEVLQFRKVDDDYIAYSKYTIEKLLYGGIYRGSDVLLQRIQQTDLNTEKLNLVKLNTTLVIGDEGTSDENAISVTVRYKHKPVYYVMELKRETMQSFKYQEGREIQQDMPLSALGKRAHYLLNAPNLNGTRLLDNSYEETNCEDCDNCETTTTTTTPEGGVYGSNYGPNYD